MGVMGAGIAKSFKKRYPLMYKEYRSKCEEKKIKIGRLFLFKSLDRLIINFPTKIHWRNNSKLEWIELGLDYFVKNYHKWNIKSVAFPQLGCGHGELNWKDVKPIMEKYLKPLDLRVEIYIRRI